MKFNPFKRHADTEDGDVADTDSKTTDAGWFLPEDSRKSITKLFETLREPVSLEAYTQPGENDAPNDFLLKFVRDIAKLSSGKITLHEHSLDTDEAEKRGVDFSPTLLVDPDNYHIAYRGAPLGEEGRSFMQILMHISRRNSGLTEISREMLKELTEEREIKVFVNPSCPYCPGQVLHAFRIAVERPDLVSAVCIDSSQDPDTADRYDVGSVPHTVVNDSFDSLGLLQEERFVLETLALRTVEDLVAEAKEKGRVEGLELPGRIAEELARVELEGGHDHHHEHMDVEQMDCVIVGAGPAGLTAGIYAERSGMRAVILEKSIVGGAVALTPVVENYPGFASVAGKNLMDIMSAHAREYCDIREGEDVREIKIGKNVEVYTNRAVYVTKALILATGATWRRLEVPGADRFFGRGVNYCAACDGYLYKNKKVVIVGGGNTALTDALHLKNLGVDVTIVHRRDAFRAQQHLQDSVAEAGIPVLWNTVVKEVQGDGNDSIRGVVLENVMDGATHEMELDGVFVAIGIIPNNQLAQDLGVELDDNGFVKVDRGMRTNIPRIYAAGDLTGGVQQIVTAIGEGSVAAISAFEDIAHPYWKKKAS
ncbi:thioredoxin reductase [Oceanidesulfovibrio indonesiensis]|uniref:Thioredoxin reductase n=1 Tax=Oceanidesulfovibrio indonesiensis TaxID=54767 RepID=A0A7M3MF20_9BACT|nr:FAD-dependent oxidoreductase [Oceanidesulfovibrio indonesiensis]TVM17607.1 thioredoxin reductase [Oceanidesulfovibrio indonesiensis]